MPNDIIELPIEARLKERERPQRPLVMYQRWEELLFLHWAVDPKLVQATLPPGLRVDTHESMAWIGVVPFQMKGVRPRFLPAVPGLSNFPELNLRTYVVDEQGRPGVWFYSLDTPQPLANWIARRFFYLNYRMARFSIQEDEFEDQLGREACPQASVLSGVDAEAWGQASLPLRHRISYKSSLQLENGWDEPQDYNWSRTGKPFLAEPDSLEFFLVERYRLFAYDPNRERLLTGQVHHEPYPLQQVELDGYSKRLFQLNNLPTPDGEPASALASPGVDVEIFGMEG